MKLRIPKHIEELSPYPPGKPLDELERDYGITNSIKLASNENPLGPSPLALTAIQAALADLHRYPDGSGYYLSRAIAEKDGVEPSQVVLGNGSNEIIEFLVKAFVQAGDEVITSHPSFLMYQKFVQVRGGKNHVVALKDMSHDLEAILSLASERTRLIFLDNPNNPCGTLIPTDDLLSFISEIPDHVVVVLDEAYIDFVEDNLQVDSKSLLENREGRCGVVCMRTFSKAFGLAGLRIGYGLMESSIAACLHKVRQPFNINQLALTAAEAAIRDGDFYQKTRKLVDQGKKYLMAEVDACGCRSYPSQTNFFLIDVRGDATVLYESMLRRGVIVRSMKAYGFDQFIRINVGTMIENRRFAEAFRICLKECGYV
ncbi:MAG: histidinol-phosphate transaminase [Desulfofustis sp.]|nr:histidinol-phosphate transaminase [Desulfofustis sp.]